MGVAFRRVSLPPLAGFSAEAPGGAVVGLIGEDGAGQSALLRLAAGLDRPLEGEVTGGRSRRYLGPADALDLSPVDVLAIEHTLALHDAVTRARAAVELGRLRSGGATVLMASHEEHLLGELSDEIWWLHQGGLAARGDPREVLEKYRRHVAERVRGGPAMAPLEPSLRRGDGRAELLAIEILGQDGQPAMVLGSGEASSVRVTVRYRRPVADPVVGIMIRTRIGFEVFGTNTELERVRLGPCAAGETLRVTFHFPCQLCPREYTLTAASHDPDGVWHDWMEDAVAFSVADARYTAGVANLHARVEVERGPTSLPE